MGRKITNEDYRFFVSECCRYIAEFGLTNWIIFFSWRKLDGAKAMCFFTNKSKKAAQLVLGKDWEGERVSRKKLSAVAFHEVIHVLLGELPGSPQRAEGTVRKITHFFFPGMLDA